MTRSWLGVEPGTNRDLPREQVVCNKQDDSNHLQTHSHVRFNLCSGSWKSYRWWGRGKHSGRRRCPYQGCQDCVRNLPRGGCAVCSSCIRCSSVKLLRNCFNWLYERWLSHSLAMLSSHTLLPIVFTKSVRGNSYTNMTWDMGIKWTMDKGSQVKSGFPSILQHKKQLLEQCSQTPGRSCWPKTSKDNTFEMPTDTDARRWAGHTWPSCVITSVWLLPVWPSITHHPRIIVKPCLQPMNSLRTSTQSLLQER